MTKSKAIKILAGFHEYLDESSKKMRKGSENYSDSNIKNIVETLSDVLHQYEQIILIVLLELHDTKRTKKSL